jgi:hypothetical protein
MGNNEYTPRKRKIKKSKCREGTGTL